MTKDKTAEERDERLRKATKRVIQILLEENILLSDQARLDQLLSEEIDILWKKVITADKNEILSRVVASLIKSTEMAQEIHWGKPEDEISIQDVDNVLKGVKKIPVESSQEEK